MKFVEWTKPKSIVTFRISKMPANPIKCRQHERRREHQQQRRNQQVLPAFPNFLLEEEVSPFEMAVHSEHPKSPSQWSRRTTSCCTPKMLVGDCGVESKRTEGKWSEAMAGGLKIVATTKRAKAQWQSELLQLKLRLRRPHTLADLCTDSRCSPSHSIPRTVNLLCTYSALPFSNECAHKRGFPILVVGGSPNAIHR